MVLYEDRRELITKNRIIELTTNEFKLMQYLIKNKKRNCTYKELIMYIYNIDEEKYKYFKVPFMTLLTKTRKKIEKENLLIITIYNYGIFIEYVIDSKEEQIVRNFERKTKINKLKKEIKEKTEQLKILEENIYER